MKKIVSVLALAAVMASCAGFGGDKITNDDTKSLILQSMLICQRGMLAEVGNAMYEEDYVFGNNTATMNVKFSTSCGLKTTERTAYEVELNKWTVSDKLALTTGDVEKGTTTQCKITISGKAEGVNEISTWASPASNVAMAKLTFSNEDTDGLTLTIYNEETKKNIYSGTVYLSMEVTSSQGNVGGNFKYKSRINSEIYDAPVKIWKNAYTP